MGYSSRCTRPARSWGTAESGYTLERACHSCTPPCDTALFRSLPDLSGDKMEEELAQDFPQTNYPGDRWSTGAGGSDGFTAV